MKNFREIKPHLYAVLLFIGISFAYFSPLLEGKVLDMQDIKNWKGMSKEVVDYRNSTGEEALWTNSMFSGMPSYQISVKSKYNLVSYVDKILMLGIPRPANILFLYLLASLRQFLTFLLQYISSRRPHLHQQTQNYPGHQLINSAKTMAAPF